MNVEFDLKEILLKIDEKIEKIDKKVDRLTIDVNQIKVLARSEAELKGEIRVLDEKIDGIAKRVDTQEFINRGVIVGLILAVLGGFAKIFGFVSNP